MAPAYPQCPRRDRSRQFREVAIELLGAMHTGTSIVADIIEGHFRNAKNSYAQGKRDEK